MHKYKASTHAVERYKERVGGRGKGQVLRHHAENWLNQVIPVSEFIEEDSTGKLHYRYKQFLIIVGSYNHVITISYYKGADLGIVDEITETLKRKLSRTIKPYRTMYRKLSIQLHEEEIKRLKVHNPQTKSIIGERIKEIQRDLQMVSNRLKDIEKIAKDYKVDI